MGCASSHEPNDNAAVTACGNAAAAPPTNTSDANAPATRNGISAPANPLLLEASSRTLRSAGGGGDDDGVAHMATSPQRRRHPPHPSPPRYASPESHGASSPMLATATASPRGFAGVVTEGAAAAAAEDAAADASREQSESESDVNDGDNGGDDELPVAAVSDASLAAHHTDLVERRRRELDAAFAESAASDAPVSVRLSYYSRQERVAIWLQRSASPPTVVDVGPTAGGDDAGDEDNGVNSQ